MGQSDGKRGVGVEPPRDGSGGGNDTRQRHICSSTFQSDAALLFMALQSNVSLAVSMRPQVWLATMGGCVDIRLADDGCSDLMARVNSIA